MKTVKALLARAEKEKTQMAQMTAAGMAGEFEGGGGVGGVNPALLLARDRTIEKLRAQAEKDKAALGEREQSIHALVKAVPSNMSSIVAENEKLRGLMKGAMLALASSSGGTRSKLGQLLVPGEEAVDVAEEG